MERTYEPRPELPKESHALVNVFAVITSVLIGAFLADVEIRRGSYRNLAKTGIFNELQAIRKQDTLAALKSGAAQIPGETAQKIKAIEKTFRREVKDIFEKSNLHGHKDYWPILQRNQKMEIGLKVSGAIGVTIGVILTIFNHKSLKRIFSHDANKSTIER